MCLTTKANKVRVAKKDIKVFVSKDVRAERIKQTAEKGWCTPSLVEKETIRSGWDTTCVWEMGQIKIQALESLLPTFHGRLEVDVGLHSYKYKRDCIAVRRTVFEAIIPRGAIYFIGHHQDRPGFISSALMLVRKV